MNPHNNFTPPNTTFPNSYFPYYNMYGYPDLKSLDAKLEMLKVVNSTDHNLIFKDMEVLGTRLKMLETKNDMILAKLDEISKNLNNNTTKSHRPYKSYFNKNHTSPLKKPPVPPKSEPTKPFSDFAYKFINPIEPINSNKKIPPMPKKNPPLIKKKPENPQVFLKVIDDTTQPPVDDISQLLPTLLSGIGPFGKISKDKNKQNNEQKDDVESVISEVSEYDSEDEFEELDLNVESLDDLIKLGDLYDKLKDTIPDATVEFESHEIEDDEYIDKTMEALKEFGLTAEFFEKELGRKPHTKVLTRATIKKNKDKADDTVNTKKKGGYELNGKRYSVDLKKLNNLQKPLIKLREMIGMGKVKETIIDVILYYIQRFEKGTSDMLHTIIEGPPGVGKTELGKILGKVFKSIGIIKSDRFTIATRSDLIGEYLGHTAAKTQRVIDEAEGGILFIDEAYSLGNEEKRDSFAKECIDTINLNLDKKKGNLIVIIAGYKEELEKSFFSYNPGLKRRFPFVFSIDGYEAEELRDIFLKKVNESQWHINTNTLDSKKLTKFFKENKSKFPHFGGDMETLFQACKFVHSKRVLGKHPKNRRKLTEDDIYNGLDKFKEMRKKKDSRIPEYLISGMYS